MYDIEKMKELQKNLDTRKYLESINNNCDMSGKMPYCKFCALYSMSGCTIEQPIREDLKQCAKAYLNSEECDKSMYIIKEEIEVEAKNGKRTRKKSKIQ